MTKEEFLTQIKKNRFNPTGLERVLKSDEAKLSLSDRDTVLAAVAIHITVFKLASEELKSDREFVMQVVLANGTTLRYASDDLKADKEVVTAAVSQKGSALEYASDDLKADKEVVMAAVSHEGSALEYASDDLKSDREIVTKAIHKDVFVLKHVSNELKDSIIDKTVKLERHFDDGYGTVYCIGRTYMSLPQLHGYFEICCGTKETLFDTKSEDSLIKFLNSEIESKISWDDWQQLKCDLNDVMDLPDFGEDAGNNVDDLKIFVNNELIVTF